MALLSLQMMLPYLRSSASSLSLSIVLPFMFLFSLIFMLNPSSAQVDCSLSLFNCGDIHLNISYPFWTELRPDYCRYPGKDFEITCYDAHVAQIEIATHKFHVMKIDYETQTATIVDMDFFYPSSDLCPFSFPYYKPLDFNHFQYSNKDHNLTLLYNCPKVEIQSFHLVGCPPIGGAGHSYLTNESVIPDSLTKCEKKIIPLLASELEMNMTLLAATPQKLRDVIAMGFEVTWSPIDPSFRCWDCSLRGGHCRYNDAHPQQPSCYCNGTCPPSDDYRPNFTRKIIIAGLGVFFLLLLCFCCCKAKCSPYNYIFISRQRTYENRKVEAFLRNYESFAPKRYRYSELKKITNSFKDKLGQGGYGGVYKGKFSDNRLVAVKLLNSSKGNGEEFINEVASIGRTYHVNVVSLLGFCYEGSKRALIYEFMPNGSLEKFIYCGNSGTRHHLGCEKLFQIAVGIARGLEYLHRGCSTRILHFDIKPHNILLDDDFCPKISDFGLAKICPKQESMVSMLEARGTVGYIAPEVFCRSIGAVSYKSDVYSYGMMVLEMVGGRKNIDAGVENTSEIYFPHWVYERISLKEDLGLSGNLSQGKEEIAKKMILVGLWCIQTNPAIRPSMSRVVDMLDGSLEVLQMPPKPYLYSPSRPPSYDLSTAEIS